MKKGEATGHLAMPWQKKSHPGSRMGKLRALQEFRGIRGWIPEAFSDADYAWECLRTHEND
ncbi:hypothetical protein HHA02_23350 [Cobetia marina]|nr:hypothetical protein HHA02_23350 [Cobetia marina]